MPLTAAHLDWSNANVYVRHGWAKLKLGDKQGAFGDFTEAIRLKSDHAEAYFWRGCTKLVLGDKLGAIADFNEAVHLQPDYADAYFGLAVKSKLGDRQGAITALQKAMQLYQKQNNTEGYCGALEVMKKLEKGFWKRLFS